MVSRAVLIASGIRSDGYREILGVKMGDTESFATWDETFRWLKGRGLKGVMFVISDPHGGLTESVARHFQGASWQRCQVHLMRNILGHCALRHRAEVAALAKRVLQASDMAEARRHLGEFAERFAKIAPKAVECLEAGFEDAMAVMALPEKYRKRLRSTNLQERLNEEIRRRERVIPWTNSTNGQPPKNQRLMTARWSRLMGDGKRFTGSNLHKSWRCKKAVALLTA